MTEKEKNERLLHKMNVSRKRKIRITMLLMVALLACIINIVCMVYSFVNHGKIPDVKWMLWWSIPILWFAFLIVLRNLSGRSSESDDSFKT